MSKLIYRCSCKIRQNIFESYLLDGGKCKSIFDQPSAADWKDAPAHRQNTRVLRLRTKPQSLIPIRSQKIHVFSSLFLCPLFREASVRLLDTLWALLQPMGKCIWGASGTIGTTPQVHKEPKQRGRQETQEMNTSAADWKGAPTHLCLLNFVFFWK